MGLVDISCYVDDLHRYAVWLTRDSTEADDLVQDTCVHALSAIGRLREQNSVKGWLFTILRNNWITQLRRRRRVGHVMGSDSDMDSPELVVEPSRGPSDLYQQKMTQEQVRAAIQNLPPAFRQVILLHEFEELSYKEIADLLGCPIGTVMSRLARARLKLRGMLFREQSPPATTKTVVE